MARFNDKDLLLIKKALEFYAYDTEDFTGGFTGGCEDNDDAFGLITQRAEGLLKHKEIDNMQELDETANKILNAIEKCKDKINKKLTKAFT